MKIFYPLFLSGFLLLSNCSDSILPHKTSLPNIVLLLADDLGYADLSCYGGFASTPNLDRLAAEGIRLTSFYAAAPNCSPSRAGLMTGRAPSKIGIYNYLPPNHPMHLKAEEITLAEVMKQKKYHTGHFGKWHLSCLPQNPDLNQPQPHDQGFDYSFGTANNAQPSHLDPVNFVRNGQKTGKIAGYSCQIVANEAKEWLEAIKKDQAPFFMYVAFHEPHKKVASPPALTAKYHPHSQADAEYLANVENLDLAIGQLLDALASYENTLILFASDNGSYRKGSNGPLLGGKSFVYEGGIRVPGILHWKGKIKGGQSSDEPAGLIDLMPTICEVLGVRHQREALLDGTSLVPLFQERRLERKKPMSWFFYRSTPEIAMRIGAYSVLGRSDDTIRLTHPMTQPDMDYLKQMTLKAFELYHLPSDLGQSNNIDYRSLDLGPGYQQQLVDRLEEIQKLGTYWDNLPPATGNKKIKSEWRQLHPKGFSN